MRSRDGAARIRCWQLTKDPWTASGFEEPKGPPPQRAKDLLGAAVTLAIIGVYLLQVTNGLASRCVAELSPHTGPGACSGLPAMASHVRGIVTVCVIACAALAVIAFIWYMFSGYKTNGQARGDRGI